MDSGSGDIRFDRPAKQTIYAVLNGKQLPTEETLEAMVSAWAPEGRDAIQRWKARRREVQDQLAAIAASRSMPFSLGTRTLFQDVPLIVDHSAEAAAFHKELISLLAAHGKNAILASVYPEKTAHAVWSGYRLPTEHVLNDFIRIAGATEVESANLRELWRQAISSVEYLAAMVILAGGQGLMGNARLQEMNLEEIPPHV